MIKGKIILIILPLIILPISRARQRVITMTGACR